MRWLYEISTRIYHTGIRLAYPFYGKAKQWVDGRKATNSWLTSARKGKYLWFHCASLGEFEQGKPVMETLRKQHPEYKLVVTFFSPSGYEIRKNYSGADQVLYLPAASASNARKFLDHLDIALAVFVKYEFWYPYLKALHQRSVPVFLIAAVFRDDQPFFKWYGGVWREMLGFFSAIFVQEEASKKRLEKLKTPPVYATGDTRFDRVIETALQAKEVPLVNAFTQGRTTIIAGSSWGPEEEMLATFIRKASAELCFVIAPHDVGENHIRALLKKIPENKKAERFTRAKPDSVAEAQVLVVDQVGYLSSIYRYGDVAFIGGAFGKGLHNILEASVFGMPVIFGPDHQRFPEAADLIDKGGALSISDETAFLNALQQIIGDPDKKQRMAAASALYVREKQGATRAIVKILSAYL